MDNLNWSVDLQNSNMSSFASFFIFLKLKLFFPELTMDTSSMKMVHLVFGSFWENWILKSTSRAKNRRELEWCTKLWQFLFWSRYAEFILNTLKLEFPGVFFFVYFASFKYYVFRIKDSLFFPRIYLATLQLAKSIIGSHCIRLPHFFTSVCTSREFIYLSFTR